MPCYSGGLLARNARPLAPRLMADMRRRLPAELTTTVSQHHVMREDLPSVNIIATSTPGTVGVPRDAHDRPADRWLPAEGSGMAIRGRMP